MMEMRQLIKTVVTIAIIILLIAFPCFAASCISVSKTDTTNVSSIFVHRHRFYINAKKFKEHLIKVINHQTEADKDFDTSGMLVHDSHIFKYELIRDDKKVYLNLYEFIGTNPDDTDLPLKKEECIEMTLNEANKLKASKNI